MVIGHPTEYITTGITAKTLVDLFGRRNLKLGAMIIMKRTQAYILPAFGLQLQLLADEIDNVSRLLNLDLLVLFYTCHIRMSFPA